MSHDVSADQAYRPEPLRVLVVQGHPRKDSFCAALAAAYAEGARAAGAAVHVATLADMVFIPDVGQPTPKAMTLEPDLKYIRRRIEHSDHLVFVYPTWWGTMPARLKALLDRILTSGWAFQFHADHRHWDQLLSGRTAELITTMDTPPWAHRLFNRRPGHNAMRRATLGFCGITTVRETVCGPVITSTPVQRARWLMRVRAHGQRLQQGPWRRHQRGLRRLRAWLTSLRLQFYPMTWVAYSIGAFAAPHLSTGVYWLGYALLFLLEAATVWTNEIQDYDSDRHNRYFGPFNGGSRVLVSGALSARQLSWATLAALLGMLAGAAYLLPAVAQPLLSALLLVVLSVLALGYTLPPLRLSYRGLGELDVAVTHSIAVLLCGFVFQGGAWHDATPWLLSLPLGLAVFGGIVLGNIPDIAADRANGKRTLPVRLGPGRAAWFSAAAVVAATITAFTLPTLGVAAYGWVIVLMPVHALLLLWRLLAYARRDPAPQRIDGLLLGALSFILWFCLPLFVAHFV